MICRISGCTQLCHQSVRTCLEHHIAEKKRKREWNDRQVINTLVSPIWNQTVSSCSIPTLAPRGPPTKEELEHIIAKRQYHSTPKYQAYYQKLIATSENSLMAQIERKFKTDTSSVLRSVEEYSLNTPELSPLFKRYLDKPASEVNTIAHQWCKVGFGHNTQNSTDAFDHLQFLSKKKKRYHAPLARNTKNALAIGHDFSILVAHNSRILHGHQSFMIVFQKALMVGVTDRYELFVEASVQDMYGSKSIIVIPACIYRYYRQRVNIKENDPEYEKSVQKQLCKYTTRPLSCEYAYPLHYLEHKERLQAYNQFFKSLYLSDWECLDVLKSTTLKTLAEFDAYWNEHYDVVRQFFPAAWAQLLTRYRTVLENRAPVSHWLTHAV